jgi:hypothetical protein
MNRFGCLMQRIATIQNVIYSIFIYRIFIGLVTGNCADILIKILNIVSISQSKTINDQFSLKDQILSFFHFPSIFLVSVL